MLLDQGWPSHIALGALFEKLTKSAMFNPKSNQTPNKKNDCELYPQREIINSYSIKLQTF
jgi:hypothetical protein